MSKKEIQDGKLCAVLSYFVIGIIWFLVDEKMKKNSYVSFHVKQALVLLIFSIALGIANAILSVILGLLAMMTLGLASILMFIPTLISLIPLVLWIFGIVYSAQGTEKELPVIGQYGDKFNF